MSHCPEMRPVGMVGLMLVLLASGCDTPNVLDWPPRPPLHEPTPLGQSFQPADTGRIVGNVYWHGPKPKVVDFDVPMIAPAIGITRAQWPNPSAPRIDDSSQGIAGAVVYLHEVEVSRSRPWLHAPVRIVLDAASIRIEQGEREGTSNVGIVRRGASVSILSRQAIALGLQARGAAFFSLRFPEPNSPLQRHCCDNGIVELTSPLGHFWMRAHLFVTEHPYFVKTDAQGRFVLDQVPSGRYQLRCWLPNYHLLGHERDPETGLIVRQLYGEDVQFTYPIEVRAGQTTERDFVYQAADFEQTKAR